MQFIREIPTVKHIPPVALDLLKNFPGSRVFAFYGDMGAGKTTIIKELCRQLGVKKSEMSSPSFALINEYRSVTGKTIYHFDFYRIKDESEVFDLGYEDYFYSGNYCFIEWPEKIPGILPGNSVKVLVKTEKEKRTLIARIN
jgi:tRNA threonylcarbamoyladenosine biosynthesis protein TsaE